MRRFHPQTLSYLFVQRAKSAGLPSIRLRDVRHSYAVAALSAGEHPKVVRERLGHSNVAITLDVYSHVTREVEEAAAHRIAASSLGLKGLIGFQRGVIVGSRSQLGRPA